MSSVYDIAIIGGGIVGASLAYALNGRRSVVILEQEEAYGYHSTGRSAAEFSRRFHSDVVGRLTRASADFFMKPPEGFTDVDLLHHRGNLIIAGHEKFDQFKEAFAREQANPPVDASEIAELSVAQALDKVPFLDESWLAGAFYDPDCWDIEVENLLQGYLKSARRSGAETILSSSVKEARREGDVWHLLTDKGKIKARSVVNAAGGWADPVAEMLGVSPLGITPCRRTAIAVKVPDYDLSCMPEVNELDEDFYFKPDAGQLMISPADETPVTPHDAWPEELDIAYAAHYLSECTTLDIQHVAHSWAGLRTFAPDRLPVIGWAEEAKSVFWLAGAGGFGIQTSPALGRMAACLICDDALPSSHEEAGLSFAQFSPSRFKD